jgi:hypothetical protein
MEPLNHAFRLTQDLETEGTCAALFNARVITETIPLVRVASWATAARSLGIAGEPVHRLAAEGRESVLIERDGLLQELSLFGGWVHARLGGRDEQTLDRALTELKKLLPPPDPSSAHSVAVTFWTYGPQGPFASSRSISVPEWPDIEANYPVTVRTELTALMRDFKPAHGGQLVLWHGKVGTGKTFALRALAWEWRDWCELHYIVDPDSFFGEHADYLMSVLTQPGYAAFSDPRMAMALHAGGIEFAGDSWAEYGPIDTDDEGGPAGESKSWRLLVLEDTGELLTPDAKAIIGQGLSRFLNVVDGLIGQGLRVLVLVTTNEEIRTLHPAVARPGRCAANIEFAPFTRDEATAWLQAHGSSETAAHAMLLASLYAQIEGRTGSPERTAGFAG